MGGVAFADARVGAGGGEAFLTGAGAGNSRGELAGLPGAGLGEAGWPPKKEKGEADSFFFSTGLLTVGAGAAGGGVTFFATSLGAVGNLRPTLGFAEAEAAAAGGGEATGFGVGLEGAGD